MINEFHNRDFSCSNFVPSGPGYENVGPLNRICGSVGARAGASVVDGDAFINSSFSYYQSHKWRYNIQGSTCNDMTDIGLETSVSCWLPRLY